MAGLFPRVLGVSQIAVAQGGLMNFERLVQRAQMIVKVMNKAVPLFEAANKDTSKGTSRETVSTAVSLTAESLSSRLAELLANYYGGPAGAEACRELFSAIRRACAFMTSEGVKAIYELAGFDAEERFCNTCGVKFFTYKGDETRLCEKCGLKK